MAGRTRSRAAAVLLAAAAAACAAGGEGARAVNGSAPLPDAGGQLAATPQPVELECKDLDQSAMNCDEEGGAGAAAQPDPPEDPPAWLR